MAFNSDPDQAQRVFSQPTQDLSIPVGRERLLDAFGTQQELQGPKPMEPGNANLKSSKNVAWEHPATIHQAHITGRPSELLSKAITKFNTQAASLPSDSEPMTNLEAFA